MRLGTINPLRSSQAAPQCMCDGTPPRVGARSREHLRLLPAVIVVLLPKCPFCVAAWFGALGSVGASAWLRAVWGIPLAAGLLSIVIVSLALAARRCRDGRPLLAGALGAAALFGSKYGMDRPILAFGGLILLIAATLWSGRLTTSRSGRSSRFKHGRQGPDWTAMASHLPFLDDPIGGNK